jgi:hypothetical protein
MKALSDRRSDERVPVAGGADPGTCDIESEKVERVVPNALFDVESGKARVSAPGYIGISPRLQQRQLSQRSVGPD